MMTTAADPTSILQATTTPWHDPQAPRIFRSGDGDFHVEDTFPSAAAYTPDALRDIAGHGFNGVWVRGKMRDLAKTDVLPEWVDPQREQRLDALRGIIARGHRAGVGLYLYFTDPTGLPADDPFWDDHPQLAGEPFEHWKRGLFRGFCLSHPDGAAYLQQATDSIMRELPGLAGVILITASEEHTHCWSHYRYRNVDGPRPADEIQPMQCWRCAPRRPEDLVAQVCGAWRDAADRYTPTARVLAWNWSWSFWYDEPQAEVVDALPTGVDVLIDFERGGHRSWFDRRIVVDEYALSYVGPSERFIGTRQAAGERPALVKLQIGTTHEMATVPNLPLITNLHAKLLAMTQQNVNGLLACWNFGCTLTLNTYALRAYLNDSAGAADVDRFCRTLARDYLGVTDTADASRLIDVWSGFSRAFDAYPFSVSFVYFSPIHDAPGYPLTFDYHHRHLDESWRPHEFGDRMDYCLSGFTMDDVIRGLTALLDAWRQALVAYEFILSADSTGADHHQQQHRRDELSCARMIGLQVQSTINVFRFHRRREQVMQAAGLSGPCRLPTDDELLAIMRDELAVARATLPIVEADARLGYHQEAHGYLYDADSIRQKIIMMQDALIDW